MDLVYNRAFPVGTKCVGGIGPDVHDLDWNPKPVMFDGATGVLACAISDRMRVFREERSKNYSASLLCDRKAPPGRSCLACKWALHDPMTLATGGSHLQSNAEQDGSGGIIRLLRYEDKHFNTMKVLKVDKGEDVSQLSWEREGRYLLATVNLGDGRAKIYVINHASRTRTKIAQIIDHPKSTSTPRARTFTTKFHPRRPIFISVGANQAWVWNKDRDWTLAYTLQLGTHLGRISRPPIICFDEYGERLAVCEFDDSVSVWTFTDKEITRIPKFELIARHVPAAADRRLLRGAVSIDWIKDKIVAADVHSIYLFSGNLRLITQGKLQLTCKRETHTHYYQQKCVKINPQSGIRGNRRARSDMVMYQDKRNPTHLPKRNYQKELAYYDEPPLPGPDGIDYLDAVDDWDTRTLITLPSSDEEDPDDVTEEDDEIEEVANKLHANLEIPPHTGHVADVTSQDDEHVAPSTAEVEVGAGKTIKGNIEDLSNKLQANMKIEPHTGHVAADATNQDDSGTGVALRGALPDEPWKIPSGKRIFCNRALNMKNIAAVGFHMEHTLAKYKYQEFGDLIYSSTLDKLVKDLSYPEELLQWKFDCKFIVRGLVIDKYEGNILKIDKNNVVELAFHGSREMPKEDIAEVYGNKLQASFEEPYYTTVDDLFSMVEAHLFSQLVTFKDNSGEVITEHTYEVMYRNVRQAFHLCCRDGSLNREFHKDLSRYIHIDLDIIPMLKMIRESGCRTFLVTDSFWDNTDAIMKYLCSPAARDYGTHNWLEYFDIVMTGCLKRNFFKDHQAGLLAVELCSGKLLNADIQMLGRLSQPPEQMQKVYQGGNAGHVKKLLAVGSSSQIFYASQQMYEDVFPSNKNLGWRTMLIIPELDQEISVFSESDSMREELKQLRITCSSVEDKIHHCNWYLRSQTLAETGKGIFEHERHELLDELKQLNENQRVANRNYQQRFNMRWGQIMKAGRQSSMFAHQAKSVPCIYTSSVTNLIHYDWSVEYSPQEDYMAHEFTGLGL